jgi:hypothetical protein
MKRNRTYGTSGSTTVETTVITKADKIWLKDNHNLDASDLKLVVIVGEDILKPELIWGYKEISIMMEPKLLFPKKGNVA